MGITATLSNDLNAKSVEMVKVDPSKIVINALMRARWEQRDQGHIDDLAARIAKEGQFEPVLARKVIGEDGKATGAIELIAGEHRLAAGIKINNDAELSQIASESVECTNWDKKDGVFRLSVHLVQKDDLQALFAAIDENDKSKPLSPIDKAFLAQRLKDEFKQSNDDIAKRLNCGAAWVSRLLLLMKLDKATQMLVHQGKIPQQKAMDMASLNADQRKQALEEAKNEDGGFDPTALTAGIRNAANANATKGDKTAPTKQVGRNMTEFRKDLQAVIDDENSDPADVSFCKDLLRYCGGKVGFKGGVLNAADRRAAAK